MLYLKNVIFKKCYIYEQQLLELLLLELLELELLELELLELELESLEISTSTSTSIFLSSSFICICGLSDIVFGFVFILLQNKKKINNCVFFI